MVVFRTFGVDIPEVAQEMSMFATGQHPCYPEVMCCSHGSVICLCAYCMLIREQPCL